MAAKMNEPTLVVAAASLRAAKNKAVMLLIIVIPALKPTLWQATMFTVPMPSTP